MTKSAGGNESGSPPGGPAEAVQTLGQQLLKDPDNQDIRLRLVRALHVAGRTAEFERESATYMEIERQRLEHMRLMDGVSNDGHSGSKSKPVLQAAPAEKRIRRFADEPVAKPILEALAADYEELRRTPKYLVQLDLELSRSGGRPTSLMHAARLSARYGGAQIYFKLEYAAGGDAYLAISAWAQAHLAHTLGRKRVVAGVRSLKWALPLAAACAHFGLQAEIFIEKGQVEQNRAQVFQLRLMGAQVTAVDTRQFRAADIREAGLDAWLRRSRDAFLFVGLDSAPDPYPLMARDHNAVIGRECRRQVSAATGRLPDLLAVRGGQQTDALGLFPAFLDEPKVRLACVESQEASPQEGTDAYDPFIHPHSGDERKRITSLLEGHEHVSVAREIATLNASGRLEKVHCAQHNALGAIRDTGRLEGFLLGLHTAHVVAWAGEAASRMEKDQVVVVVLKDRGEKDLWDVMRLEGQKA